MPKVPQDPPPPLGRTPDFDLHAAERLVLNSEIALEGFLELLRRDQDLGALHADHIICLLSPVVENLKAAINEIEVAKDRVHA